MERKKKNLWRRFLRWWQESFHVSICSWPKPENFLCIYDDMTTWTQRNNIFWLINEHKFEKMVFLATINQKMNQFLLVCNLTQAQNAKNEFDLNPKFKTINSIFKCNYWRIFKKNIFGKTNLSNGFVGIFLI